MRLFGPALLLLVLGFGITTDVEFSDLCRARPRQHPTTAAPILSEVRGSRLFHRAAADRAKPRTCDHAAQERRGQRHHRNSAGLRPRHQRGRPTEVSVWIDGAMPFRAETIHGYLQSRASAVSRRPARSTACRRRPDPPARYRDALPLQSGLSIASTPWFPAPSRCNWR